MLATREQLEQEKDNLLRDEVRLQKEKVARMEAEAKAAGAHNALLLGAPPAGLRARLERGACHRLRTFRETDMKLWATPRT